jgi:c-di-GMP-binding flagellar brake protein YcgR
MNEERRQHKRFNVRVPVELRVQGTDSPIRGETADLSLGGLYLETMFTFGIGTELDISLQLEESTILAVGRVVTCYPTVGNGIQFLRMLPEDREELGHFLDAVAAEQAG